jgi:hypothetical protein
VAPAGPAGPVAPVAPAEPWSLHESAVQFGGHVSLAPTILMLPLLLLTQALITPAVVAAAKPIVVVPTSAMTSVMVIPIRLPRKPRAKELKK